ncbi:hypothetical protein ACH5RR_015076 [Cinchona calisaya]|uniref:RNase H type-1 domain-containing protein n=1 Tax=Cinchona calisaya TaxID=153742 RepID=A0ABD2ZVN8_9GENT
MNDTRLLHETEPHKECDFTTIKVSKNEQWPEHLNVHGSVNLKCLRSGPSTINGGIGKVVSRSNRLSCNDNLRWNPSHDGSFSFKSAYDFIRGKEHGNPGVVGARDILRDDTGRWIKEFTRNLSMTNNFLAEFRGLRDGLDSDISLGIKLLDIETNCKEITKGVDDHEYVDSEGVVAIGWKAWLKLGQITSSPVEESEDNYQLMEV